MKFLGLFLLFIQSHLLAPSFSCAAPHPGVGSSPLASSESGVFFQSLGFKLSTKGTDWKLRPNTNESFIQNITLGPSDSKMLSQLNIRTDNLDKKTNLENYSKKWMRDYTNFGFETLGQQMIQLGGGKALVVDLVQKKQNKQLRQIILSHDQKIAVLTCIDDKTTFEGTLKNCNQIARSFQWIK